MQDYPKMNNGKLITGKTWIARREDERLDRLCLRGRIEEHDPEKITRQKGSKGGNELRVNESWKFFLSRSAILAILSDLEKRMRTPACSRKVVASNSRKAGLKSRRNNFCVEEAFSRWFGQADLVPRLPFR